jgi:hypothetical protein
MTTKTAMNNQSHFNRIMNWLLTVTKIIAAPCRHTTALCLLSRGLRIHGRSTAYQRLRSKEQKVEERQRERLHFAASFSADFHQFDLPYWLSPLGDDPDDPEVLPLFNLASICWAFCKCFCKTGRVLLAHSFTAGSLAFCDSSVNS